MNKKRVGNSDRAVQLATLMQPTMLHAQYVRRVVNENLFLMGRLLLKAFPSLLSVCSQADREGACDCMQQIIAPNSEQLLRPFRDGRRWLSTEERRFEIMPVLYVSVWRTS